MRPVIKYTSGYKYQLAETYYHHLAFRLPRGIVSPYIDAARDGKLTIRKGYAWDGASGPAIDTKNIMRGALVHDALYQLIRENFLPHAYRALSDKELYRTCIADGMCKLRAMWVYTAVRKFGAPACRSKRKVSVAP